MIYDDGNDMDYMLSNPDKMNENAERVRKLGIFVLQSRRDVVIVTQGRLSERILETLTSPRHRCWTGL